MDGKTGGKIALGCGSILLLLSLAMSAFFLFHLVADPGGAISDDEAAPGVGAGALCFLMSLAIIAGGAFLAFRGAAPAGEGAPE